MKTLAILYSINIILLTIIATCLLLFVVKLLKRIVAKGPVKLLKKDMGKVFVVTDISEDRNTIVVLPIKSQSAEIQEKFLLNEEYADDPLVKGQMCRVGRDKARRLVFKKIKNVTCRTLLFRSTNFNFQENVLQEEINKN